MRMFFVLSFFVFSCSQKQESNLEVSSRQDYAIVIHGGAGTIIKGQKSEESEREYTQALNQALDIGLAILKSGGSSLNAVEQTIKYMEDNPLFNAGKGSVFTNEGKNELDASIMYGKELDAGAVGGVMNIKNPISAARMVMEKSPHVMMVRQGAQDFAISHGLDTVDRGYFFTQGSYDELQRALKNENHEDAKKGTVGCVALDKKGNISAGTSTGGMTNKRNNRIGDSPIIGAGTYADNSVGGVSCTGHGEYFIRHCVAKDIIDRMNYLEESVETACNYVIHKKLSKINALGGVIALDKHGNVSTPFNTSGMYRAYANPTIRFVKMYQD